MDGRKRAAEPAGRGALGGRQPLERRQGGFTMVETALAMTVLVVAMMSLSAASLRTHALRRQNRERAMAQNAVRAVVDRIQSTSEQILDKYPPFLYPQEWSQRVVQALSPGGSIGSTFPVPELNATQGGVPVGSIQVVLDENVTDAQLGAPIGMPRDLNGDGVVASTDVTLDAVVLPVVVSVTWRGISGTTTIDHPFYLTGF